MSLWTFLVVATAIWGGVELFTKIFENDKEARIAKIEAALKRDLVKQLGDAELVAKVIEARLPRTGVSGDTDSYVAEVDVAGLMRGDASKPGHDKKADATVGSGLLLGGMICSLVGVGFLVLAGVMDEKFIVPGILVTAVGFALLAYPSARDEVSRSRRRRQDSSVEA